MRTFLRRTLEAAILTGGFTLLGAGVANAHTGNSAVAPVQAPVTVCGNGLNVLGGGAASCAGSSTSGATAGRADRADRRGPPEHVRAAGLRLLSATAGLTLQVQPSRSGARIAVRTGGTLPYTGVSLWLLLIAGLLTLVVGTSLTVASSRRRTG